MPHKKVWHWWRQRRVSAKRGRVTAAARVPQLNIADLMPLYASKSFWLFDNDGVFTSPEEHRLVMAQTWRCFVVLCRHAGVRGTHRQVREFRRMQQHMRQRVVEGSHLRLGTLAFYFHQRFQIDMHICGSLIAGAISYRHLRPLPPAMITALEQVVKTRKVAVFTNAFEPQVKKIWQKKGIAHLLPFVQVFDVTSTLQNNNIHPKPNPTGFWMVLQKLGTSPDNVVFFDDKLSNVLAAETLGLQAFWVHRQGRALLKHILAAAVVYEKSSWRTPRFLA